MRRSPHGKTEDVFDEHGSSVISPFAVHLTCPLRIMFIASIPRSFCHAEWKPEFLARSNPPLYSSVILGSTMLFRYWTGRQWQGQPSSPAALNSDMAFGYDGFRSTLILSVEDDGANARRSAENA